MPNWCSNSISIQGPTDKIRTIWHRANDSVEYSGLLNAMVEMPEELRGTTSPGDPDEVLQEKYGASNWYDWRVSNWGTKWDIDNQGLEFTDLCNGTAEISGWLIDNFSQFPALVAQAKDRLAATQQDAQTPNSDEDEAL